MTLLTHRRYYSQSFRTNEWADILNQSSECPLVEMAVTGSVEHFKDGFQGLQSILNELSLRLLDVTSDHFIAAAYKPTNAFPNIGRFLQ
jgi:hypothetical protein